MNRTEKNKKLADILANFDPVGLISQGAPRDEYKPEADEILSSFSREKPENTCAEIKRIFVEMFDTKIVGSYDFGPLASRIEEFLSNNN